ncbi:MAG: hypothetical protein CL915_00965 [Deltaproteobacteria bacterium]|nr:hypothetical protein [Deltaproteobacteria bacterium]
MLIFAAVAVLALTKEWELGYSKLIPYVTPGLITFDVFSLPAGWLADRWSREGVIGVFFVGIGLAAIGTSKKPGYIARKFPHHLLEIVHESLPNHPMGSAP